MSFDVGQRVSTPRGEAFVLSYDAQLEYVFTDRGVFRAEETTVYVDVKALRDPDTLEAWLEEEGRKPSRPVEARQVYCTCRCGTKQGCYRVEQVDQATQLVVARGFPHTPASGACRCANTGCDCLLSPGGHA